MTAAFDPSSVMRTFAADRYAIKLKAKVSPVRSIDTTVWDHLIDNGEPAWEQKD